MKKLILLLLFLTIRLNAEMPTVRGYVDFRTEALQNTFYNILDSNKVKCIQNAVAYKINFSTKSIYRVGFYMNFDLQYIADRNLIKQSTSTFKLNSNVAGYKFEVWESNNDGIPGQCQPDFIRELLIK